MVYVRKDPFEKGKKKHIKQETILEMEDYCSVLLYARYVREADGDMKKLDPKIVPIVRRGGLVNMPETVCEEFDLILQKVLQTIEVIDVDPAAFMAKLELGDVDPIGDIVNAPEVTQALGNVMIKKLKITDGLRGESAYEEAKRLLPKIKSELTQFMGQFVFNGIFDLAQECRERDIPLNLATKVLKPRVTRIARDGIGVETRVDVDELNKIKDIPALDDKKDDSTHRDYMHG